MIKCSLFLNWIRTIQEEKKQTSNVKRVYSTKPNLKGKEEWKTDFNPSLQETVTSIAGLCGKIEEAMSTNIACLFVCFSLCD